MPLATELIPPVSEGHGFLIEMAIATGFISFQQIVIQFMLVGRIPSLTRPNEIDVVLAYHRWLGIAAIAFLACHPVFLLLAGRLPWSLFNGVDISGIGSLLALLLLALFSFRRALFQLDYETWRLLRAGLGMARYIRMFQGHVRL